MKRSIAALSLLPLLAAAACGSDSGSDGRPSIVTSAYPFAFVAERVAGDLAEVTNLTRPGGEPHDLELTAKQVAAVQSADLVVYTEHFQAAVDEAVDQADRDDDSTIELGEVVGLLAEDEHGDDHEDHDHGDEDHGDHEGHDHGGVDPHFWQDPQRMVLAAEAVRDRLVEVDPDHAADYEANTAALVDELTALDDAFTTGLATCERRTIVTGHAAFAYLADAYDLDQVPIAGLEPTSEPTGAQLAAITDLVRSDGITTIFTEALADPANAETIASETGVQTATLDPVEGLSDDTSDQTYLTLMQANLDALRKANSCT